MKFTKIGFVFLLSISILSCSISAKPSSLSTIHTLSTKKGTIAIPAFIGYTQKANRNGQSLKNIPSKINSLREFRQYFGEANPLVFKLKYNLRKPSATTISIKNPRYYLYNSVQLFFENGGETCYIISVGNFKNGIHQKDLMLPLEQNGLLAREEEPNIIVIPDALSLPQTTCYKIYNKVLEHCGTLRNRFGIFDIHNGFNANQLDNDIASFRNSIGNRNLDFGAVYYPWVKTNLLNTKNLSFENFENKLKDLISLSKNFKPKEQAIVNQSIKKYYPNRNYNIKNTKSNKLLHQELLGNSSSYKRIVTEMTQQANIFPVAGIMAGVFAQVDKTRGIWKAPANVSLNRVIHPSFTISNNQQTNMNVDATTGISVNAIRSFTGKGTVPWGARTMASNSKDWRYVPVRRLAIMIEQAIKKKIEEFVFEPNDQNTWVSVQSEIELYLNDLWRQGALAGEKPKDAFAVRVGLNSTMTAHDINEGKMIVDVMLAFTRPAEFTVIRLEQNMQ